MRDVSARQFGAICAILLGVVAVIGDVVYFLLPVEQRIGAKAPAILPAVAHGAPLLMLQLWLLALEGVLGLAVVPLLSDIVRARGEGWVRWTSTLATVGFAVTAVSDTLTIARLPGVAAAYVAGDAATKAALAPVWKSSLDLYGLWGYGAVGVWVIAVSYLAMQEDALPRPLAYTGLGYGALLIVLSALLIAGATSTPLLVVVALATVLAPIFWIWSGWLLLTPAPAAATRHA